MTADRGGNAIHLLFPDGSLSYHCASCDQRCCARGASFHREHDRHLLQQYPALRLFLRAGAAPDLRVFDMPQPRCYFLHGDGRCHLQVQDGYQAKPAMCRLFPVNIAYRLERHQTLLIGVNLFCPLELSQTAQKEGATRLRHAEIGAEIEALLAQGQMPARQAPAHLAQYPEHFLELEAFLRDAAMVSGRADYTTFCAEQMVCTDLFCMDLPLRPSDEQLAAAVTDVRAHVARVAGILGFSSDPEVAPELLQTLLVMTGLLRMNLFMLLTEETYYPAASRVPLALAGLAWLCAHQGALCRAVGGVAARVGPQAVNEVFTQFGGVLILLTHLQDRVSVVGGLPAALRRFDESVRNAPGPLDAHLRWLGDDPAELMVGLRTLAQHRNALRFHETQ